MEALHQHYDEKYYAWQKTIGTFGGIANRFKFENEIMPDDFLVDFGAGGGFLLAGLNSAKKVGVEINDAARSSAEARGLTMTKDFSSISSDTVDVVISNHALEHVDHPLMILREVLRVLKPGGKAIFVVPCEHISYSFVPDDNNFHLYSWSPM